MLVAFRCQICRPVARGSGRCSVQRVQPVRFHSPAVNHAFCPVDALCREPPLAEAPETKHGDPDKCNAFGPWPVPLIQPSL